MEAKRYDTIQREKPGQQATTYAHHSWSSALCLWRYRVCAFLWAESRLSQTLSKCSGKGTKQADRRCMEGSGTDVQRTQQMWVATDFKRLLGVRMTATGFFYEAVTRC